MLPPDVRETRPLSQRPTSSTPLRSSKRPRQPPSSVSPEEVLGREARAIQRCTAVLEASHSTVDGKWPREKLDAYSDLLDLVAIGCEDPETGQNRRMDALAIVLRYFDSHLGDSLINETINQIYDLCEDGDRKTRQSGYTAVLQMSRNAPATIFYRNADALCQLLDTSDEHERKDVEDTLVAHCHLGLVETLEVMLKEYRSDDRLRRRILRALHENFAAILAPAKQATHLQTSPLLGNSQQERRVIMWLVDLTVHCNQADELRWALTAAMHFQTIWQPIRDFPAREEWVSSNAVAMRLFDSVALKLLSMVFPLFDPRTHQFVSGRIDELHRSGRYKPCPNTNLAFQPFQSLVEITIGLMEALEQAGNRDEVDVVRPLTQGLLYGPASTGRSLGIVVKSPVDHCSVVVRTLVASACVHLATGPAQRSDVRCLENFIRGCAAMMKVPFWTPHRAYLINSDDWLTCESLLYAILLARATLRRRCGVTSPGMTLCLSTISERVDYVARADTHQDFHKMSRFEAIVAANAMEFARHCLSFETLPFAHRDLTTQPFWKTLSQKIKHTNVLTVIAGQTSHPIRHAFAASVIGSETTHPHDRHHPRKTTASADDHRSSLRRPAVSPLEVLSPVDDRSQHSFATESSWPSRSNTTLATSVDDSGDGVATKRARDDLSGDTPSLDYDDSAAVKRPRHGEADLYRGPGERGTSATQTVLPPPARGTLSTRSLAPDGELSQQGRHTTASLQHRSMPAEKSSRTQYLTTRPSKPNRRSMSAASTDRGEGASDVSQEHHRPLRDHGRSSCSGPASAGAELLIRGRGDADAARLSHRDHADSKHKLHLHPSNGQLPDSQQRHTLIRSPSPLRLETRPAPDKASASPPSPAYERFDRKDRSCDTTES
ncbi:unnamed protein product [Parajaminaea phylloscopi]